MLKTLSRSQALWRCIYFIWGHWHKSLCKPHFMGPATCLRYHRFVNFFHTLKSDYALRIPMFNMKIKLNAFAIYQCLKGVAHYIVPLLNALTSLCVCACLIEPDNKGHLFSYSHQCHLPYAQPSGLNTNLNLQLIPRIPQNVSVFIPLNLFLSVWNKFEKRKVLYPIP